MIDKARAYLGKTFIGTNQSDAGQCVGLFNKVVYEATGILYPIQGAGTAFQILTAKNTRPDICQQVKNNPGDPNQLPSVGDWVIFNQTWGSGMGHIVCVESRNATAFTAIEQNYVANTVTRQQHDWRNVAGWIHFSRNDTPAPTPPPVDPTAALKAENTALKAQVGNLTQQVNDLTETNKKLTLTVAELTKTVNEKQAEIDQLADDKARLTQAVALQQKQIADLQAQLAIAQEDSENLNKLGVLLKWLLVRLGINKAS